MNILLSTNLMLTLRFFKIITEREPLLPEKKLKTDI